MPRRARRSTPSPGPRYTSAGYKKSLQSRPRQGAGERRFVARAPAPRARARRGPGRQDRRRGLAQARRRSPAASPRPSTARSRSGSPSAAARSPRPRRSRRPRASQSDQVTANAVPKLNQAAVAARERRHRRGVRAPRYTSAGLQGIPPVGTGPGRWLTRWRIRQKLPPRCAMRRRSWGRSSPSTSAAGTARRRAGAALDAARRRAAPGRRGVLAPTATTARSRRLARGELTVDDCDPGGRRGARTGRGGGAEQRGLVQHAVRGPLDPTGMVKGWAVERAARMLAAVRRRTGVSLNGGGDVQLLGTGRSALAGGRLRPAAPGRPRGGDLEARPRTWPWPHPARPSAAPTSSTRAPAAQR